MAVIKKVTMQEIADACGLSRNTVSKIFNNRGSVPESTRELVIQTAQRMGYIPAQSINQSTKNKMIETAPVNQNIALITYSQPMSHNFGALFITNFAAQISRFGYNLKIFQVSETDYTSAHLPEHFDTSEISGIVTIEVFDRAYTKMLCDTGLPVILIDSYVCAPGDLMTCDIFYMENFASAIALTQEMIGAGASSIGFVGDINHCSSFRERWNGYRSALTNSGLPVNTDICILADDSEPYGEVDWINSQLDAFPYIPDAFFCANDFIAIRLMQALHKRGFSIPQDIMITGFDGSPESEVVYPSLTTAQIPSAEIGSLAADVLLERIASPDMPYRCTFVRTTPVWRESTHRQSK